MKNDDDTSNEEISDNEYSKESECDNHNVPIIEDIIEGDEEESSPEIQGRGH